MSEFKVRKYRIRVDESKRGPETPFTVVFLSDLHNAAFGNENKDLLQEIRNENPAAVFTAGDMLTASKDPRMDVALNLMDELTKMYSVYCVNGNHESRLKDRPEEFQESYEKYVTSIRSLGVHLLENTYEQIEIHRMPITVWGLELPNVYYRHFNPPELTTEKMQELLGAPIGEEFQLLLAHHPAFFEAYAGWGADLTLAGHMHGGVIRLPKIGGIISPQFGISPHYSRGQFTLDDKKMIVSAGLGGHSLNIRINDPPELDVIDFT